MNGPQRTACLAKGYNNGKYKWIEVLVMGKKQWKLKLKFAAIDAATAEKS